MKTVFFILLFNLFNSPLFSSVTCDSIVIAGSNVQTYREGLLISDSYYIYSYDSLGKLITVVKNDSTKTYHYYSISGSDSAVIWYRYNGHSNFVSTGQFFINDTNGNIMLTYDLTYDTTSLQWDTTYLTYYYYSTDSLTRSDTIYTYPGNQPIVYQNTIKDSLGRIVSEATHGTFDWSETSYIYDSICTEHISSSHSFHIVAGPFGSTSSTTSHWIYDSICRPAYVIDTNYYQHSMTSSTDVSIRYYAYADCNNIAIVGSDSVCMIQPGNIIVNVYGGNGPYTYSWTGDSLSAFNILNPVVYTDTGNTYHLIVTDTGGNSSQFSQTVLVNYFTTVATNASCGTCSDGSVVVNSEGAQSNYTLSISPDSGIWNGNVLSGLPAGHYNLCSHYYLCTYCDSVHITSPIGVNDFEKGNFIRIFPNPVTDKLNVIVETNYLKSILNWSLSDVTGRSIMEGNVIQKEFNVSVEGISPGIYYFIIIGEKNSIKKIVIQ